MRKGGGKSKGSGYEREICKKISLWLTNGKRDDIMWRSAMSGGRSTVAKKKGEIAAANAGDISAVDKKGYPFAEQFYSECKAVKDLNIKGLVKELGKLVEFWIIAGQEAEDYKKLPLLWCKENNFPQFICMSQEGAFIFGLTIDTFDLVAPRYDLYLLRQDRFFEEASPRKLKKVKRERL